MAKQACGAFVVAVVVGAGWFFPSKAAAAPVGGGFTVTAVSPGAVPVQLVTGTDGRVWFLTAQSELGVLDPSGVPTLAGAAFPHGTQPATLVSAGPEGAWAYANGAGPGGGCVVALAGPGRHVLERILHHPVNPICNGGARDPSGDLWVSLHGGPSSAMAKITAAGVVTVVRPALTAARPRAVTLGSDGAIWAFERAFNYGRSVPGGPVTTVPILGPDVPPIPGAPFFGVRLNNLLPRPDGTFWVVGGNAALSLPGHWLIRFNLGRTASLPAVTPDGALWTITSAAGLGSPGQRLQRLDEWGVHDRTAVLPVSPRNGAALTTTGSLAAQPDGSLWTVASDGAADFTVHYLPTAIPRESIWTGAAGDGKWSTSTNWLGGTVPQNGSVVVLRGSGSMVDDLPPLTLQEVLAYGTLQLSGGVISLASDGIQVTGYLANLVVANPITTPAGGSVAFRADPRTTLTITGVVSGGGGITTGGAAPTDFRNNMGLVWLTGDNSYTGPTLVLTGHLRLDGHQPASAVTVMGGALSGGGTTGPLVVQSGSIDYADEDVLFRHCPQTLTVMGDLVLGPASLFLTIIQACGTPSRQTLGSVLVTGSARISKGASLSLALFDDKPQVACLLSSQGPLQGQFAGVGEGSTQPDPAGGHVVFSYSRPGGPGCFAHAFTATTGVP